MSTAKNIIENLENQIGVPNAFGSEDLYDAVEHENFVDHTDVNGKTTRRLLTEDEKSDFEHDFMCELENDMKDYE